MHSNREEEEKKEEVEQEGCTIYTKEVQTSMEVEIMPDPTPKAD